MSDGRSRIGSLVPKPVKRTVRDSLLWATTPISSMRLMPHYLILGGQRCGTTSLYRYLVEHPTGAGVRLTKGAHYFDSANFHRGPNWYRAHFPTTAYARWVRRRHGHDLTVGEGSPYYLFHPLVPARVRAQLPDVKVIAMLRHPVDRAYSHYQHERARGFEELSFEEAIDREPERVAGEAERMLDDPSYESYSHQHHTYLGRGLYLEQLLRWNDVLPPARMLVLHMEEFFAHPETGFRQVLEFLEMPAWSPPQFERYNARRYSSMPEATRRRLEDVFREPNRRLFEYLGKDLGWNG